MKKAVVRALAVDVIVLVMFNLIAFMIPFVRNEVYWVSYGFALAAFCVAFVCMYLAFVADTDAKSRFHGFPLARIGVLYGAAQIIASVVVMSLSKRIPWVIPTLVYALGLGGAVIAIIATMATADGIKGRDDRLNKNITMMRALYLDVNLLAMRTNDPAIRTLAEEIRYSDPVSSNAVASAEAKLAAAVRELKEAVENNSGGIAQLCSNATLLLEERNYLCKMNKH